MFVTSDAFVQFLHPSAVAPRQQYWRLVTLTLERHWYLVVYKVIYQGRKVSQTALVAWDATLVDLLAQIPTEDLIDLARLDWQGDDDTSWSLQRIDAMDACAKRGSEHGATGLHLGFRPPGSQCSSVGSG